MGDYPMKGQLEQDVVATILRVYNSKSCLSFDMNAYKTKVQLMLQTVTFLRQNV